MVLLAHDRGSGHTGSRPMCCDRDVELPTMRSTGDLLLSVLDSNHSD